MSLRHGRKSWYLKGDMAKARCTRALFFIACFGIRTSFKRKDIRDLVVAANAKEVVGVLQESHMLMNKIPCGTFCPYEFRAYVFLIN